MKLKVTLSTTELDEAIGMWLLKTHDLRMVGTGSVNVTQGDRYSDNEISVSVDVMPVDSVVKG